MRHFIILCLLLGCSPAKVTVNNPSADIFAVFPEDFLGNWAGDLVIHTARGVAQTIPMQLRLQPVDDSTYTYTIVYGEDEEAGTRPYLLKEIDRAQGRWLIDEQNTIILDGYYLGGVFYETFSVQGTLLTAMLEKRGEQLIYGITAGPQEPDHISGDQIVEGDTIPPVASYKLNVYQRAVLDKVE